MDEARDETREEPLYRTQQEPRLRFLIPLVVACAMLMDGLDQTIIATSLPQLAASLGERPLRLNLAITAYLTSLAVFIPVSGWVAERFGARTVFCAAVTLFTLSSALCGAAVSLPMLVATRMLQGAGGALMTPVGRMVILRSFPKSEMVVATGYVMMPAMIGPALGPLLGGFLTTYFSWRWIFYINVPFGALGVVLALRYFDDFRSAAPARFDLAGFVMCGLGFAAAQLALEFAGRGGASFVAEAALVIVALACLAAYLFYAHRTHDAVIDLDLFHIKSFRIANLGGTICRIGFGSTSFLLPLLLQIPLGYSAFASGLMTSLLAVGAAAMRIVTPRVLRRWGFRAVILANGAWVGAMMMALALIGRGTPHWAIAGGLLVLGFFRSLEYTALGNLGYSDLFGAKISSGSSVSSVMQQLSQSFGVAIAAALLGWFAGAAGAPTQGDFAPVFTIMAAFPMVSLLWFARIGPEDGRHVSGHRGYR